MTKMPEMQKIPNLLLLVNRDHQLVYFTMLSPCGILVLCHVSQSKTIQNKQW